MKLNIGAVWSCSYQVAEFWRLLTQAGFTPLNVELEPWHHYAWYRFEVAK